MHTSMYSPETSELCQSTTPEFKAEAGAAGSATSERESMGVRDSVSSVDHWQLLSPALHNQRHSNIAGKKHGGAFSRKVVEEMVERMELMTMPPPEKVGKLSEQLPEDDPGNKARDLDWV